MINIAVILTCYNRRTKTIDSLQALFKAVKTFNDKQNVQSKNIRIEVFLTDDGSTDGTSDAIIENFSDQIIHILKGDGNLYWAGGMRFAWGEAIKRNIWDYFLLLNDDTILFDNAFEILINTHLFCVNKFKKAGIYSGITCDPKNICQITYGGDVFINKLTGARIRLGTSSEPQICDVTNANILLVHKDVVNKIGILYEGYRHSAADYDYSYMARKSGFPVLITAAPCGTCEFDHTSSEEVNRMLKKMSFKERKNYLNHPLHSNSDYLLLIKRTLPFKYPITWLIRKLHLYCPYLYYWLNNKR